MYPVRGVDYRQSTPLTVALPHYRKSRGFWIPYGRPPIPVRSHFPISVFRRGIGGGPWQQCCNQGGSLRMTPPFGPCLAENKGGSSATLSKSQISSFTLTNTQIGVSSHIGLCPSAQMFSLDIDRYQLDFVYIYLQICLISTDIC